MEVVVEDTLMKLDSIDIDDEPAREAASPTERHAASVISQTLFMRQRELSDLATRFYPGSMAPMQTPTDFLDQIKIRGTSLTDLFRRSPSRFMADVSKPALEMVHSVRSAIQHAVWSSAAMVEGSAGSRHRGTGSAPSYRQQAPAASAHR